MKLKSALLFVLIAAISLSGCSLFRKKSKDEKKPPINEPINVIDVSERPYLNLNPRNDGREVTLVVNSINKQAQELEYELEYQAGTLLQGAFGSIDFTSETPPVSKKILLGSCSAGGACSYHEDVQGGTLTLKFRGDQNYALKTEWRFQPTADAKGKFSSRDSKFQLDAAKLLDKSAFVIVMQTSGLPGPLEGTLLSDPYGLFPSNGLPTSGKAKLSMRLNSEADAATIYGWTGSDWQAFDTTVADKTASASVDFLEVYIVATP